MSPGNDEKAIKAELMQLKAASISQATKIAELEARVIEYFNT